MESHLSDISRVIQLAVAPVFLLTAIATLISAMNLRLGRIVDRRRVVLGRMDELGGIPSSDVQDELVLLNRRTRLIYFAILFAVSSALLVCLVVAGAFIGALIATDLARTVATLFVLSMFAMITALSLFLREVFLAVQTGTHANQ